MHKVIKAFKGSPDGHTVIAFEEGDDFNHDGDLLEVALANDWVVESQDNQLQAAEAAEKEAAEAAEKEAAEAAEKEAAEAAEKEAAEAAEKEAATGSKKSK